MYICPSFRLPVIKIVNKDRIQANKTFVCVFECFKATEKITEASLRLPVSFGQMFK